MIGPLDGIGVNRLELLATEPPAVEPGQSFVQVFRHEVLDVNYYALLLVTPENAVAVWYQGGRGRRLAEEWIPHLRELPPEMWRDVVLRGHNFSALQENLKSVFELVDPTYAERT